MQLSSPGVEGDTRFLRPNLALPGRNHEEVDSTVGLGAEVLTPKFDPSSSICDLRLAREVCEDMQADTSNSEQDKPNYHPGRRYVDLDQLAYTW